VPQLPYRVPPATGHTVYFEDIRQSKLENVIEIQQNYV
jgi:hypothetical protein